MSRKIFVSYKYADTDVRPLDSVEMFGITTRARHYVDVLESLLDINDHIYKGENDNESLAGFKDTTIESKLRDKIFDSGVTIVLISKNMKDPSLSENDQWIPWEISYSLKEMTRGDRTSRTNAMLGVVLPDSNGSYHYMIQNLCSNGCRSWQTQTLFGILGKNMFNRKQPNTYICPSHNNGGAVHNGDDHSYIHPIEWDKFITDVNGYINLATQLNDNIDDYNITKIVQE